MAKENVTVEVTIWTMVFLRTAALLILLVCSITLFISCFIDRSLAILSLAKYINLN